MFEPSNCTQELEESSAHSHIPTIPNQHVLSPFHPSQPETIARQISLVLMQKVQSLNAVFKSATGYCVRQLASALFSLAVPIITAPSMLTPDKPPLDQEKTHEQQAINMQIFCKITISSPPLTNLSVLQR